MISMMLSRILGYARDVVIYSKFGQVYLTDAYNAAFSIPDFYTISCRGALSSAFIPCFPATLLLIKKKMADVASTIFNLVMILMFVGIVIGIIFTSTYPYLSTRL